MAGPWCCLYPLLKVPGPHPFDMEVRAGVGEGTIRSNQALSRGRRTDEGVEGAEGDGPTSPTGLILVLCCSSPVLPTQLPPVPVARPSDSAANVVPLLGCLPPCAPAPSAQGWGKDGVFVIIPPGPGTKDSGYFPQMRSQES